MPNLVTRLGIPYNPPIQMGREEAEMIGSWTASLDQQPGEFQASVASLRASIGSRSPGHIPRPSTIKLTMPDGTRIQSKELLEGTAVSGVSDWVRFILVKWNGPNLEWCYIEIYGETMIVKASRNPPDQEQSWRNSDPTIILPVV